MKKNVILSIFIIIAILIANISLAADTPNVELKITANKQTIQSTDKTIEVTISLGNIQGLVTTGSNVVVACEGTLEYDTNMFKSVTTEGQNEWTITYEPTTKNIILETSNAKANTTIAKLTFILNDNILAGSSGNIKFNNLVLTDETNDFTFNKEFTITSESEKEENKDEQNKGEENKDEPNKEEQNQIDDNIIDSNVITDSEIVDEDKDTIIEKVEIKKNIAEDSSQAKGSLPKAGLKNVVILVGLTIIILGGFSLLRYKMIKLK